MESTSPGPQMRIRSASAVVCTAGVTAGSRRHPTQTTCARRCGSRPRARERGDQMSISIGDKAPEFELPDTDGASWSAPNGDGATATVLVFTCNHCPYALAWHDRLAQAARDYAQRGVRFMAISSNDAERYPRDSYDA